MASSKLLLLLPCLSLCFLRRERASPAARISESLGFFCAASVPGIWTVVISIRVRVSAMRKRPVNDFMAEENDWRGKKGNVPE